MSAPLSTPRPGLSAALAEIAFQPHLVRVALTYAELGIPVFPCAPGAKTPLTRTGFHEASSSAAQVHRWWRRHPDANIGIPTGAASGLVVVDVDKHPAGSGFEAFDRAANGGPASGWAWLVRTPSGGVHAYYPARPGIEQRSWQAPRAHIDFRGDGGYIIAPGSRRDTHSGVVAYEVIATANRPSMPIDAVKLRAFLDPPKRRPAPAGVTGSSLRTPLLAQWVASRPEGGRNGGLFWAACRMVEHDHSYAETLTVLGDAAQAAGLLLPEIESTIRSAYRISQPSSLGCRPGPTQPREGISL